MRKSWHVWGGINVYLAGMDTYHPIPTEGKPLHYAQGARRVDQEMEVIARHTGDVERRKFQKMRKGKPS